MFEKINPAWIDLIEEWLSELSSSIPREPNTKQINLTIIEDKWTGPNSNRFQNSSDKKVPPVIYSSTKR